MSKPRYSNSFERAWTRVGIWQIRLLVFLLKAAAVIILIYLAGSFLSGL